MLPKVVECGVDPMDIEFSHDTDRILYLFPSHKTRSGSPGKFPAGRDALRPVGFGKIDQERTQHIRILALERISSQHCAIVH
jgi:hypothetical protein